MIRKKAAFVACTALLGLAGLAAACGLLPGTNVINGSGKVTREERTVSGIHAVTLLGTGEVSITQGASESLSIEAEDNLLPLISSEVRDGVLRLDFTKADWRALIRPTLPIRYFLTVRDLSAIELAGSGSIQAGTVQALNLALSLSGSGDLTVDAFQGDLLQARVDGSGNLTSGGSTKRLQVFLTGSGKVNGESLESQTASVSVGGSGDVTVWVREHLDVSISGSGTVNYFGQPEVGNRDISGSGDINPMGDK